MGVVVYEMEDTMADHLAANDSTTKNQERQRTEKSAEHDQEKLEGKAFQVNENTVEGGDPIRPDQARPGTGDDADDERLEGKSFQINENSVEEGDSLHPDHPRPSAG
jgi:hypothetical protein